MKWAIKQVRHDQSISNQITPLNQKKNPTKYQTSKDIANREYFTKLTWWEFTKWNQPSESKFKSIGNVCVSLLKKNHKCIPNTITNCPVNINYVLIRKMSPAVKMLAIFKIIPSTEWISFLWIVNDIIFENEKTKKKLMKTE